MFQQSLEVRIDHAARQIVCDNDFMTLSEEEFAEMSAYEANSSSNQNSSHRPIPLPMLSTRHPKLLNLSL